MELEGRVTIKEILDHFGYEHLVGNEEFAADDEEEDDAGEDIAAASAG